MSDAQELDRILHYQGEGATPVEVWCHLIGDLVSLWNGATDDQRQALLASVEDAGLPAGFLPAVRGFPTLGTAIERELKAFWHVKHGEFRRLRRGQPDPTPMADLMKTIGILLRRVIAALLLLDAAAVKDAAEIDAARNAIRRGQAVPSEDCYSVTALPMAPSDAP